MTTDPPISDASLVSALLDGDDAAATELVRRHGTPLARFLVARGAPRSDVEDLVQEAFFKAFSNLATWRAEASFRSWLYRIAGNLRTDAFRRQGGRTWVTIEDVDLQVEVDQAARLDARAMARRIDGALSRLPRLQREVFLLRAQQGLEYAEIAEVLGTTPGAARVHYHHAVRRLKEQVAP